MKKNVLTIAGLLLSAGVWVLSLIQNNISDKKAKLELEETVEKEVAKQLKNLKGE